MQKGQRRQAVETLARVGGCEIVHESQENKVKHREREQKEKRELRMEEGLAS